MVIAEALKPAICRSHCGRFRGGKKKHFDCKFKSILEQDLVQNGSGFLASKAASEISIFASQVHKLLLCSPKDSLKCLASNWNVCPSCDRDFDGHSSWKNHWGLHVCGDVINIISIYRYTYHIWLYIYGTTPKIYLYIYIHSVLCYSIYSTALLSCLWPSPHELHTNLTNCVFFSDVTINTPQGSKKKNIISPRCTWVWKSRTEKPLPELGN